MAKCKNCGKKGLFLKLNEGDVCKDCTRLYRIEKMEKITSENLVNLENKLKDKQKLIEDTQKIALKQIDNQIQYKNDTLKQILSKVDDENQILNVLMEESVKTQDIIKTNHKKIEKIKNMYKSIKYCVNWDSETFIDVDAELATIFSPTVVLHLHNMDVKDLRKQFNANKKDIEKIFETI